MNENKLSDSETSSSAPVPNEFEGFGYGAFVGFLVVALFVIALAAAVGIRIRRFTNRNKVRREPVDQ